MTPIVKAANAAQFLSVVPRMLGFAPQRSVVLIPFQGSRSLGGMRFDLPGPSEDPARITATFIGMVCRIPDADAFAAIVYAEDAWDEGMPRRELVRALLSRADDCGLRVTDALCVSGDAWGSYLDPECPEQGRPLSELAGGAPGVPGLPPLPEGDQASGAALPEVGVIDQERVARALHSLEAAVQVLCGTDAASHAVANGTANRATAEDGKPADEPGRIDPAALAAVCTLDDLPTLFEEALGWDPLRLSAYNAAALAWCLGRPALRDIALVQWCTDVLGGDEALDAQLRWESGEEYPAHLAMHMWGEGPRPDPRRLETALELARSVAALVPRALRAGPLATCAWLSWALGRSTHADLYAGQACDIEPEHGLAEIVRSFVTAGHLPDWAFDRSAPDHPTLDGRPA